MKKIILTEDKFKILEARLEGFRVDVLRELDDYSLRVKYCKKMLGAPIGNGSSRVVFQIDDYVVLKLAKNAKGIAQNQQELNLMNWDASSIIPRCFNGSDEDGYLWILAEYVIPAKARDFKEALGMSFKDIQNLCVYLHTNNTSELSKIYRKYKGNENATEVLSSIEDLHYSYSMASGDFYRLVNWGMTVRDGKPWMVILDSGLSSDIYDSYYKVRQ